MNEKWRISKVSTSERISGKIREEMAQKPVRPGKFYDLDGIWDELLY